MVKGEASYPVAKQYLDRALTIAKVTGNQSVEEIAFSSLSAYYSLHENGRLAVEFVKKCIALSGNDSTYYGAYLLVGDDYYKLGQYVRLRFICRRACPLMALKLYRAFTCVCQTSLK